MSSPCSKIPRSYTRGYHHVPGNWSALDAIDWVKPVMIEVGAGSGEWICQEAPAHPGTQFVAIESTAARSAQLIHNIQIANAPNLIALRADAILLLDAKCPPQSVDAFYFHFPNPWPKKNQANKRFFGGSAIYVFDRCLKPGGKIVLASNSESYIREASSHLAALGYVIEACSPPDTPRTAFEKKYRERGEAIFEICGAKIVDQRLSD